MAANQELIVTSSAKHLDGVEVLATERLFYEFDIANDFLHE